ncbi:MAG: ABC transporter permease [Holosporaceae bacterium]|nr:ABC transporter permease [Holosporaceae bacterium]
MKKEIIQMIRNPRMVAAIFIMPIIQMIAINFAISNEPQNIRLAMDCTASDYLIQNIHDKALASGWFTKIEPIGESALDAVQNGKIDATLTAPANGFTRSVGSGEPKLQLLIDATNVLKAQAIEIYINSIVATAIAESRLLPEILRPSINFKTRILFNPGMDSKWFMFPFIAAIMATMTILSAICISMTREKELGTIEMLVAAPIKKVHIILGKTIPYICVGFINLTIILVLGMVIFGVPFRGSLLQFLLLFFIFATAMSAFAILFSTFCQTQQQAMLGMMIFLFLSMMLSGGLAPVDNMPLPLRLWANIMPMTHCTFLMRNILLKGGNWAYFFQHSSAIFFFGLISAKFAFERLKTTL